MNDLATAPPMPARPPPAAARPREPAPSRRLWQDLLDATPLLTAADAQALDALAAIIEVTPEERQRVKETAEKVGRLTPVPVKSGVDWETIARVNLLSPQLPGIETDIGWKRVYRESQPMGHVLGYLGRVEKVGIDDDLALKVPGARVGRAGVEAGMELVLRGSAGLIR